MKNILIPLIAVIVALCSCNNNFEVYDLQCEGLTEPLGIDSAKPHFSWKIRSSKQMSESAYEIQLASSVNALCSGNADMWQSGKVSSLDQIMVPYNGKELSPRTMYWWRIRVWNDTGESSSWSEPQRFSVGILDDDMCGEYLAAPMLRRKFSVDDVEGNALLYVNTLGYHEVYLNGEKVSDAVLTPAVSQLDKRSLIVTYDVAPLLNKGENDLVISTGIGWFRQFPIFDTLKYHSALTRAELRIDNDLALVTDSTWFASDNGYTELDWKHRKWWQAGEEIDARVVPESYTEDCLNRLHWTPAEVSSIDGIVATQQMCELCTIQEKIGAVNAFRDSVGHWVIDMGKTSNAMFEITLPELPAGHVTKVSFSDYMWPDGHMDEYTQNLLISSGKKGGDRFVNKFDHHVFRYVIIEGLDECPDLSGIFAHRMRTAFRSASTFHCSDDDINAIHDMILYTMENLAFDGYMVDCANLERLGYGGDGNASTLSIQTTFDVAPLYRNWLTAWEDVIKEDGSLPNTAPCPWGAGGGPYWCSFIIQAPYQCWMNYADTRMLESSYPAMIKWMEYAASSYMKGGLFNRWPDTDSRGWCLGDWISPEGSDYRNPVSVELVNNCCLCQSYMKIISIADYLGHKEDVDRFTDSLEVLRKRIHTAFFNSEDYTYGSGTQIDMSYPMLTGVVPEELYDSVRESLYRRTRDVYNGHIGVGLVGVPILVEWATASSSVDFIFDMLKKPDCPGWLYMIKSGATSSWEYWTGIRSRMHNTFCGIGSWFYQAIGGIVPLAPGYREVSIRPQIPKGMTFADVTKRTPYGDIIVNWKVLDGQIKLRFSVPIGVTAIVNGERYTSGVFEIEY